MGAQAPFMYDHPSRYSFGSPAEKPFDPRAATRASWTPPAPRVQADGPLINFNNFNKHPDSYLIVPYGQTNATPMSPNTKSRVKHLRMLQLCLRLVQLIGALGMLFCVITIKNTSGSIAWIIRVAPAVGILHTLYGIYHLCRSATGRTPGSTASYMLFATMIDTGLLPFLAFAAIICRAQYTTGQYGWDTLFGSKQALYDIVFAAFIASTALAGLHLITLINGIALAIFFRKISKLPPDMNPLEDNLTARPHKRNKSELTIEDKNMSKVSLASSKTNRNSDPTAADPLISAPRSVPFMHTRNGSSESVAMYRQSNSSRGSRVDLPTTNQIYQHSNASYRSSRTDLTAKPPHGLYQQSNQSRSSRVDLDRPSSSGSGPSRSHPERPKSSNTSPLRGNLDRPISSNSSTPSRPNSTINSPVKHQPSRPSTLKADWTYPSPSPSPPLNDENVEPTLPNIESEASPTRDSMDIHEWYGSSPERKAVKSYPVATNILKSKDYQPIPQNQDTLSQVHHLSPRKSKLYDFERDLKTPKPEKQLEKQLKPLGMNPPTPVNNNDNNFSSSPSTEPRRVALSDSPNTNLLDGNPLPLTSRPTMSARPSSFVGSGTKGKYYGDVLNLSKASSITRGKSDRSAVSDLSSDVYAESASLYSEVSGYSTLQVDGVDPKPLSANYELYSDIGLDDRDGGDYGREIDGKGRVVSNTGYDLKSGYAGLGPEFGMGMARRGRDVSGKVVEEGKGGGFAVDERRVAGFEGGRAGWARFKGL